MSALLLITDDVQRGRRLTRDLGMVGRCDIYNLYDGVEPPKGAKIIVSDVQYLDTEALSRLGRILDQSRGGRIPYLFLAHGNAARAEAQARILKATGTLAANAVARLIAAKLANMSTCDFVSATAQRQADRARLFLTDAFFSGAALTPDLADTGTELVAQAVLETGIADWVRAVQRFDDITHQHILLVAGLSAAFACALGLNPSDQHHLAKAALLHDFGKTHIPAAILNKPGRLNPNELQVMRTHAALGHAMLVGSGFDAATLTVVRSHHEMLDGSGYPDGLRDREIPDLVRLVTICDIHAALIERRPYKSAMSEAAALAIIESMAGRLDAHLVRAFRPVADAFDAAATGMMTLGVTA